jgi:hypothetical protein
LPASLEYGELVARGWIDTHLAAGNGECEPLDGENCTSGRSETGGDLEDPARNTDTRIDYIFLVPPGEGAMCAADLLPGRTGLFAAEPNPFAESCGASPLPICWTSDHSGNRAQLRCQPVPGD